MEFIGGGVNAFGLLADDGRVHTDVTSGVRREVVQRAERPRLALLSRDEALATHDGRILRSCYSHPDTWRAARR